MSEPASNRSCIVVGVGEGLGAALARRFADGYKVALLARSAEVIEKTAAEINAAGGTALPLRHDATVEAQIAEAYARVVRDPGPVEVLIYNGGRRPMGRLMDTTPQVCEETWRLHTFGAFLWSRQVVPDMIKPSAIADAFWYLAHQDRSAWSHELDVRPFTEKFQV